MKKVKLISLIITVGCLLTVSSCKDDETSEQFTVDKAKQSMSDFSSDLHSDIIEMTSSSGVNAIGDLVSLLDLNDPFGGRMMDEKSLKNWFKSNARLFKTIFVSKSVGFSRTQEDGFDFEGNWGEYNWNPQTEMFEKSDAQLQMIVINFPTEGSDANNVTLRLTDFEEQYIEDDGDSYYQPSLLAADLSIDGVEQIALDFSAEYLSDGSPIAGSVSLFLNPFTFSVSFDDSSNTASSGNASIAKGDEIIIAINLTIDYLSSDKNELDAISGQIQYRQMIIKGDVDVNGIESAENPDPNDFVNLELFEGTNKIGVVVFLTEMVDDSEEDVPYLQYADGSQEKLEDILRPVIDEIDDFADDVESWGD